MHAILQQSLLLSAAALVTPCVVAVEQSKPAPNFPEALRTAYPPMPLQPAPRIPEVRRHTNNAAVTSLGPTRTDIPPDLPSDLRVLIENTFSADAVERGNTAGVLGTMRERAAPAVPFLIRLLSDEATARSASLALIKIGGPAVEPCIASLKQHSGTLFGDELIRILGWIRDPRAIEPFSALLSDPDPLVRKEVVESLLLWPDARLVPLLIRTLKDQDLEVRASTTWVLQDLHDSRLVMPLVDALKDKVERVRRGAVKALGKQHDRRAFAALLERLRDSTEDESVRCQSAVALGTIADPGGIEALLLVVKDRSMAEGARRGAAAGLAISKSERSIQPLIALMKDRREAAALRGDAVQAIADLQGPQAIPLLTQIAKADADDGHVRCCASMCVVAMTHGAVDDAGIVAGLRGRYVIGKSITAVVEAGEATKKALREVAEHGKTEAVRAAARAVLKERGWERK